MTRSIPGHLDLHALAALSGAAAYDARAQLHRPTDPAQLAAEVRRLAATGLKPTDIASALRTGIGQVHDALGRPDAERVP